MDHKLPDWLQKDWIKEVLLLEMEIEEEEDWYIIVQPDSTKDQRAFQ